MGSICPFFSMVAWKQTQPETVVMARLRCKSWQCPHCAGANRTEWRKFLLKKLPRVASDWWFITLTAHENNREAGASLANIRTRIDRLMKRVQRVWGKIQYVRVYETHKKGAFHCHLVCSGLSSGVERQTARNGVEFYRPCVWRKAAGVLSLRTYWRKTCRNLGMGYMVDVQTLESVSEALRYVTKYLTKDAQNFVCKHLRRVQTTRGIGSPRSGGDGSWVTAARVFRENVPQGARLYDADRRVWIPEDYWSTRLTYPQPNSPA